MEVIVIADEEQETQQLFQDDQGLGIANSELVAIFYKKVFKFAGRQLKFYYIDYLYSVKSLFRIILPAKLPILFDGWDDGCGRYFIAVYTFIEREGNNKYILLGMQPLPTIASYRAVDHELLLKDMIEDYGKSVNEINQ
jgi:hypothetical protein